MTERQNTLRVAHGRFAPGQSGNPGGRPKGYGVFRAAAVEYDQEALETLVSLMRSAPPAVQLAAAREILDRAYGRPSQAVADVTPAQDTRRAINGGSLRDAIMAALTGQPDVPSTLAAETGAQTDGLRAHKHG